MNIINFKVIDLSPKEKNPKIAKLLPTNLRPYRASFDILNVNIAVANALRRVILSELPVKSMKFKKDDIVSDDEYILKDMIASRIRLIPLKQDIPDDLIFSLKVLNKTDNLITVKSGNIKPYSKFFNETYPIIQLNPGKKIVIKKIYIKKSYSYKYGASLACNATCVPLDISPEKIKSSVSDPHKFRIAFNSNGNMDAKKLIKFACEEIILSLKSANALLDKSLITQEDIHIFTLKNSSDTIGNLLMKTIIEEYPDLDAITYYLNDTNKELTLRIKSEGGEVKKIISSVVLKLINLFDNISATI